MLAAHPSWSGPLLHATWCRHAPCSLGLFPQPGLLVSTRAGSPLAGAAAAGAREGEGVLCRRACNSKGASFPGVGSGTAGAGSCSGVACAMPRSQGPGAEHHVRLWAGRLPLPGHSGVASSGLGTAGSHCPVSPHSVTQWHAREPSSLDCACQSAHPGLQTTGSVLTHCLASCAAGASGLCRLAGRLACLGPPQVKTEHALLAAATQGPRPQLAHRAPAARVGSPAQLECSVSWQLPPAACSTAVL